MDDFFKKDVILFDLDGTLTDPRVGIFNALRHALKTFGLRADNPETLEACIGPPLRDIFRNTFGFNERDTERAVEVYREYFGEQGIYENELYEGITPMLASLQAQGKTLALATSKAHVFAKRILEHLDIARYFTCIVGAELDGWRSDKDQLIRHALELLKAPALSRCVMVGDRKYDILGAKKLYIGTVGVLYGFGSRAELSEAGADHIVRTVQDLAILLVLDKEQGTTNKEQ